MSGSASARRLLRLHLRASGRRLRGAVTGLGLALLGACGATATTPATQLVAGAMLPRTGPNANSDWVAAVQLALLDMNDGLAAARMAKPITFRIEKRDTASSEQTAHDVMAEYASLGAKVVISEASNAAIGANKANYDASIPTKLPVVAFTATSSSLNKVTATDPDPARQMALQDLDNWFFRTCPVSDALSAIRLRAVFMGGISGNGDVNGDGLVKVVWIGTTDTATVSSIAGDRKAFLAAALDPAIYRSEAVVFDPGTDPNVFNYNDVIGKAVDSFNDETMTTDGLPDLLINKALPNVSIPLIKAYDQGRFTIPVFEDGAFRRNALLAALGLAANGQQGVSNIAFENNSSGKLFAIEQQAQTGWAPAVFEAQGYDAMALGLLAVVKASVGLEDPALVTPAAVRDALTTLNEPTGAMIGTGAVEFTKAIKMLLAGDAINYSGASGNVDFNSVGDVKSRAVLWKVEGGQFVEKQVFDCVTDSSCPPVAP